jgi:hypothetical protein
VVEPYAETVTTGLGLTVTVTEFEAVQPAEFFSVTVYTVVIKGLTDGPEEDEVNPAGELVQE